MTSADSHPAPTGALSPARRWVLGVLLVAIPAGIGWLAVSEWSVEIWEVSSSGLDLLLGTAKLSWLPLAGALVMVGVLRRSWRDPPARARRVILAIVWVVIAGGVFRPYAAELRAHWLMHEGEFFSDPAEFWDVPMIGTAVSLYFAVCACLLARARRTLLVVGALACVHALRNYLLCLTNADSVNHFMNYDGMTELAFQWCLRSMVVALLVMAAALVGAGIRITIARAILVVALVGLAVGWASPWTRISVYRSLGLTQRAFDLAGDFIADDGRGVQELRLLEGELLLELLRDPDIRAEPARLEGLVQNQPLVFWDGRELWDRFPRHERLWISPHSIQLPRGVGAAELFAGYLQTAPLARSFLVAALLELREESIDTVPALVELLSDEDEIARYLALRILRRLSAVIRDEHRGATLIALHERMWIEEHPVVAPEVILTLAAVASQAGDEARQRVDEAIRATASRMPAASQGLGHLSMARRLIDSDEDHLELLIHDLQKAVATGRKLVHRDGTYEVVERALILRELRDLGPRAAPAVPVLLELIEAERAGEESGSGDGVHRALAALAAIGPAASSAIPALERLRDDGYHSYPAYHALWHIRWR